MYHRLGKSSEINPLHVDFLVSVSAPFWITDAEHGRHLLKARPYPSINLVAHMNVRFVISDGEPSLHPRHLKQAWTVLPDAQRVFPMHMA